MNHEHDQIDNKKRNTQTAKRIWRDTSLLKSTRPGSTDYFLFSANVNFLIMAIGRNYNLCNIEVIFFEILLIEKNVLLQNTTTPARRSDSSSVHHPNVQT